MDLYHIGNHPLHAGIYSRALERPGVVLLHDALLQHFLLKTLTEEQYVSEFVYNYGAWHESLAQDLYRGRAASGLREEIYRYPMLRRIASAAQAVIVHNPAAARRVREHAPDAFVFELPHLFEAPSLPAPLEVSAFRESLGIGAEDFLFGLFGYLRESKRVATVLEAFCQVRAGDSRVRLLVAGDFVSIDLPRTAAPLLAQAGVVRLGHLESRRFWLAASACDACVNLRFPAAGETSGITVRLMGIGKPVIVSEIEENAGYPDGTCARVTTRIGELSHLVETMVFLSRFREEGEAMGGLAQQQIRRVHDPLRVALQVWKVLGEANRGNQLRAAASFSFSGALDSSLLGCEGSRPTETAPMNASRNTNLSAKP